MYIDESIRRLQEALAFFEEKFPAGFDKYWDAGRLDGQPETGQILIIHLSPVTDTLIHKWVRPALNKTGFAADIARMNTSDEIICGVGPNSVLALAMYFQQLSRSEPHLRYITMEQAFDVVANLIEPLRDFTTMAVLDKNLQLKNAQMEYSLYGDDTIVLIDVLMQSLKRTLKGTDSRIKCPGLKEMQDIVKNYDPSGGTRR